MTRIINQLLPAGYLLFVIISIMGIAQAATFTVCPSSCDYLTIQDSINETGPGNIIEVYSGAYFENINVTKQLTLRGVNTSGTDPIINPSTNVNGVTLSADYITLEGFTITNSNLSSNNTGIKIISNYNMVYNNSIINNGLGIFLHYSNNNTIINNILFNNTKVGVLLNNSNYNAIISNNISKNEWGIVFSSSHYSNITNNLIQYGTQSGVVFTDASTHNNFSGNRVSNNNDSGIAITSGSNHTFIFNNTVNSNLNNGIDLSYSNNNIVRDNTANSNYNNGNYNYGIHTYYSNGNFIINNTANLNKKGIDISHSIDNIIENNTVKLNYDDGIDLDYSRNNLIRNNIVKYNNDSGIDLYYSPESIVLNNFIESNVGDGIDISYSNSSSLVNNIAISNNDSGIGLENSPDSIILNNYVESNKEHGIGIFRSNNSTVSANIVKSSRFIGIAFSDSHESEIDNNIVNNNAFGIYLHDNSSKNIVVMNIIYDNMQGLQMHFAFNNILYLNDIGNSTYSNAVDNGINQWDNGTDTGNHYSNYDESIEGCTDFNNNSICDLYYNIPGGSNVDRYPISNSSSSTNATSINFGENKTGHLNSTFEIDKFTFLANSGDLILIKIESSWYDGPEINLMAPNGTLISNVNGQGQDNSELTQLILEDGEYTILVRDYRGDNTGRYKIFLENINNRNSTFLNYGENKTAIINSTFEIDAYTFSASSGDSVIIRMSSSWYGGPEIRLIAPNGTLISHEYDWSRYSEITEISTDDGNYTILVGDYEGDDTGSYEIYIQNITNLNSIPIAFGEDKTASINSIFEIDAYTFSANSGDHVFIRMSSSWNDGPEIRLFAPDGTPISNVHKSYGNFIELTQILTATGEYTILAGDYEGDDTGNYEIYIQRINNPINSTPIGFGENKAVTINSIEMNAYNFSANSGDNVLIRMSSSWNGGPEIRLFAPDGTPISNVHKSYGNFIELTQILTATGEYTILAGDYEGDDTGNYEIYIQRINNPINSTPIGFDENKTATINSIEMNAYNFSANSGDNVLIRMTSSWNGGPEIRLFAPDGTLISKVFGGYDSYSEMTQTLNVTGEYTILAGDYKGDDTGSYEISIIQKIIAGIVNHTSSGLTPLPISFVRFNFSGAMDETSFSLAEDIVSFTGPNGNVIATGYNWLNSHTLEVTFESQYTLGEYEIIMGPEILDLEGNAMDQDGDQIPGEISDDRYIATFINYVYSPTTDVIMNETDSSTHVLYESVIIQNATLNTSVTGDFSGTLNFTTHEITLINSGSFTGKGFSKGIWSANIEGNPYIGDWKGMLFKKPDERKIHLKGEVSGDLKGIVEGYLVESVNGSDIYDQYQATWTISQIGSDIVFAKLDINGMVNHLESNEYLSELYALQTSIDGEASGYYNRSLSMVLTHVRIDNETNPNYGQGFSIISYVSESGSGEGWTYDNLISSNVVKMNGISSDPLTGIVSGTLDESTSSRTVTLSIGRIDVGLPPATDLKIMINARKTVSPGDEISYTIEISNQGTLSANDLSITNTLSPFVEFKNAGVGIYSPENHSVFWGIEELKPLSKRTLFVEVESWWGLSDGTIIRDSACVKDPPLNNTFYPGINWMVSAKEKYYSKMAYDLDATLRYSYADTDALMGATHVWLASKNIPTTKNYLSTDEGDGEYRIAFSHSGGTQTLMKKIETDRVKVNYAVFAAPALINQAQVENLIKYHNVKKVIIVQSDKDILYQIEMRIEKQHVFMIPGLPPIYLYTRPAATVLKAPKNTIKERLQGWFAPLFPRDMTNYLPDNIYPASLPETEDFWIGGSNRNIQTNFSGSPDIIVIDEMVPDGVNSIAVHEGLLTRTVQRYINGGYPFNGQIEGLEKMDSPEEECSTFDTVITVAHDPNIKYGPEGFISPTQKLNYTVEYENEGEGIAFGVYFTDILDADLDYTTLEIGPVKSTIDDSIIAPPGEYNPTTRTIVWFVGEVGPKEGGYANISVNVRSDAAEGTEVINYATVYFPSVPEETRTNGIVSIVDVTPPRHSNVNQSNSSVIAGDTVEVYAYWQDGVQLNYTWLETNESGTWQNVSYLNHSSNEAWSIFTISTIQEGEVCWRIHANDTAGNENVTQVQCFDVMPDKTPPHSITNPTLQTAGSMWLNWTWTNPSDPDFNHTEVYLNGISITNIPAPLNYYNATGLLPDTSYELSTRTVDTAGNVNETWVNHTATTAPSITISNRSILLNNHPFTLKSIGYSPVPIGIDPEIAPPYGDYFTSNYDYIYNRDLPLLRQMGANTIRLWGWNNSADHTDFLDKAYNNGIEPIYVIVTFWMGHSVYQDISSPEVRARAKTDFRNMVSSHKNHPAVLMWAIGNELNAPWMYGNNPTDLFSLVNEMAQEAHIEEGENYHPVTLPLADIDLINTIAAYNNTSTLDVWSIQTYRGRSFGSLFIDYANVSSKPLVITEHGIDAYDNKNGTEYELIGTPYQAVYASSLWNEIMSNSNISSGGSIMAYSDEWWKGKHAPSSNPNAGCPEYNSSLHSNCGYPAGSHPDGYSNEEWWGIMRTHDNDSYPDIMEPRAAYYALQSLWTNDISPPASIINLADITRAQTYINWTWINPSDSDFNHTEVYLNGTFITNIPAPHNYYNATGLLPDTSYELSTRTVDTSGNINQTWVNDTATTTNPLGDFSGDDIIDAWDITYLARHIAGIAGYETLSSGDVSGDGVVDVWDCTYLARAIAGIPGYNV